jgi:hypothetical protein
MQGDPHVRFDEQGVETDRLASPAGESHATAPPPDSTRELPVRFWCRLVSQNRPEWVACELSAIGFGSVESRPSSADRRGGWPRAPQGLSFEVLRASTTGKARKDRGIFSNRTERV